MPSKELYQKRKEQGLCTTCGGPRSTSRLKCQKCAEEVKESQRKLIETRKNSSLCRLCGMPTLEGCSLCEKHSLERAERDLEIRQKCLREGVCTRCHSKSASATQERCEDCILLTAEAHQNKKARRRAMGMCLVCGLHPMHEEFLSCEFCLEDRCDVLQKNKDTVFKHYGEKCNCCSENTKNFLTMDHIEGGGLAHIKEEKLGNGGSSLYSWIIRNNFPNLFQTLCFNCNFAKHVYGKCPHEEVAKGLCIKCKGNPSTIMELFCEECFRYKNMGQSKYSLQRRVDALGHYGTKCYCCEESVIIFLGLDHIDNDGTEERKLYGSGDKFYVAIKKLGYPKRRYRAACHNCNSGRAVNGGVCPHDETDL